MDVEIHQLMKTVKATGYLCLNLSHSSQDCRKLFEKLYFLDEWKSIVGTITAIELPMEDYVREEENIISLLSEMLNLKLAILSGGRHAKDGTKLRGGLIAFPENLLFSTSISTLDLSFNMLEKIPACIQNLHNLEVLMLDFNNIIVLSFDFLETECKIKKLHARSNKIIKIDKSLKYLSNLEVLHLTSNMLAEIPDIFNFYKSLVLFDVSANRIETLPVSLFQSLSLRKFYAGFNAIVELPVEALSSKLELIDVRYNHIVNVGVEISNDSRFILEGNISLHDSVVADIDDYDVVTSVLDSDVAEFELNSSKGSEYILPSGVRVLVPNNFSCQIDRIYCNILSKELHDFKLRPTDQLLSVILELLPNGISFSKAMRISLPYHYSSCDVQSREIVMRVTSVSPDGTVSYEDLKSETENDSNIFSGHVTAFVNHFSMFAVVSRLVENRIRLYHNVSSSLFSTVNHFTKLFFPENSASSPTDVIINVLAVSQAETEAIVGSAYCPVGNVLHVSVIPRDIKFSCPVTVHLALPRLLIGLSFDHSQLRLLKCHDDSENWTDITDQVNLIYSTIDVSFQVDSFSKFWLVWKNVMGVARKVYQRAITYKVQFIAMQKKVLPTIVLAQCIRSDLVESRVNQLLESGYFGEDVCSEIQELMEGDKFKIQVIGEIRTKTSDDEVKKHLEENSLIRSFRSQYPPEKCGFKFCVESCVPASKTATGYVSFYKVVEKLIHSFESDYTSANATLQNTDNIGLTKCCSNEFTAKLVYLDDILITLQSFDTKVDLPESIEYPLHFGEYGTGMFQEATLRSLASQIGAEWEEVGHYLGIRTDDMERIKLDHPNRSKEQIFFMLQKWSRLHMHDDDCVSNFAKALKMADRTDLAEKVLKIYENGVAKFKDTIKRAKGLPRPNNF